MTQDSSVKACWRCVEENHRADRSSRSLLPVGRRRACGAQPARPIHALRPARLSCCARGYSNLFGLFKKAEASARAGSEPIFATRRFENVITDPHPGPSGSPKDAFGLLGTTTKPNYHKVPLPFPGKSFIDNTRLPIRVRRKTFVFMRRSGKIADNVTLFEGGNFDYVICYEFIMNICLVWN